MGSEIDRGLERYAPLHTKVIKARSRTYFIDLRSTKRGEKYITITEKKCNFGEGNVIKHKIFLYKEDLDQFVKLFLEVVQLSKEG